MSGQDHEIARQGQAPVTIFVMSQPSHFASHFYRDLGISAETTAGQDRPSSSHIGRNQSSGLRIKQTGSYRGNIEMTESTITQGNSMEGVALGAIEQEGGEYASKARGSKNTLSRDESLNEVKTAPKPKMAE